MKYKVLIDNIINYIGGRENISTVNHCMTRLRFTLHDESKVDIESLKKVEKVITVIQTGGQYQVVIGSQVKDVYSELVECLDLESNKNKESESENAPGGLLDIITGVFVPLLSVLPAAGLIKGISILLASSGWVSRDSGTFQIINAIGSSFFYYFPIILAITAARKFKMNEFVAFTIGATLVLPATEKLSSGDVLYTLFSGSFLESPVFTTFFGIPIVSISYVGTVIPVIAAIFFAAKIEGFYKARVYAPLKNLLTPVLTLLTVIPLTLIIIGPISTLVSHLIGFVITNIYDFSPIITGLVMGACWQLFVMFGVHWVLISLAISNIATLGYDSMMFMGASSLWATAGVVLAIFFKTKDKNLKLISFPAFISALIGVTEPALYGITLPRKIPFYITLFASSMGGMIMAIEGTRRYSMAGPGMVGLPGYINPETGFDASFYGFIIASVAALIIGFILTYVWGYEKSEQLYGKPGKSEQSNDKTEELIEVKS